MHPPSTLVRKADSFVADPSPSANGNTYGGSGYIAYKAFYLDRKSENPSTSFSANSEQLHSECVAADGRASYMITLG